MARYDFDDSDYEAGEQPSTTEITGGLTAGANPKYAKLVQEAKQPEDTPPPAD
jgi:hypothetical protein